MPDENSLPQTGRRQQDNALHLGPRKKAYIPFMFRLYHLAYVKFLVTAASPIHSFPMAAILAELFMPYVTFKPSSRTVFCVL